ncbi:MAG: ChbG/HpnK family deacetylase [Acidobacteria bacterium]|nr:ChbG/HpnK family deacetylase [Acidobacteriota bacterium]
MKRLIVNADDFGFTRDVNEGIVRAHLRGIVTSTTLMANGSAFQHAAMLAKDHAATLGVGIHLTLIGERALGRPGKALPATPRALAWAVLTRGLNLVNELESQVSRVLAAGIEPTHLDTHKHAHLLPQVADVVGVIAERHQIPWVRRPLDKPVFGALSRRRLEYHGCRMTDRLLGFDLTGRFGEVELEELILTLPAGLSEFLCHPGLLGEELAEARTRLKESRVRELDALESPRVRAAVQKAGIQLVSYRNL